MKKHKTIKSLSYNLTLHSYKLTRITKFKKLEKCYLTLQGKLGQVQGPQPPGLGVAQIPAIFFQLKTNRFFLSRIFFCAYLALLASTHKLILTKNISIRGLYRGPCPFFGMLQTPSLVGLRKPSKKIIGNF